MQEYEFILKGMINQTRVPEFENMEFSYTENHNTKILGLLKDQAELHGLINLLYDQGFQIMKIEEITGKNNADSLPEGAGH